LTQAAIDLASVVVVQKRASMIFKKESHIQHALL